MKTVFETEVNGNTYRHLYYFETTEATVENLIELIDELSGLLKDYHKEDFCRMELQSDLTSEFDSDRTLVNLRYRISKLVGKPT